MDIAAAKPRSGSCSYRDETPGSCAASDDPLDPCGHRLGCSLPRGTPAGLIGLVVAATVASRVVRDIDVGLLRSFVGPILEQLDACRDRVVSGVASGRQIGVDAEPFDRVGDKIGSHALERPAAHVAPPSVGGRGPSD